MKTFMKTILFRLMMIMVKGKKYDDVRVLKGKIDDIGEANMKELR